MPVSKDQANHVVGRICGVEEGESKIAAVDKVIEIMRLAGFSTREINKAIKLRNAAVARGVK